MPNSRPDMAEIISAVRECLQEQILPVCNEPALNLNVRICMSLLATVVRELDRGAALAELEHHLLCDVLAELQVSARSDLEQKDNYQLNQVLTDLLENVPNAATDRRIMDALYQITLSRLEIDNPKYPALKAAKPA